ncbi:MULTISPECIES: hypothetical protein [Gordonia]|uniref:Uncharacterized protein n=1 Tax=Gordonia sihwensis NBRC 108236 TaxID=1223544 RepID=L7LPY7_9ACTN|nr:MULTISPECIES: hypothetical protein [Gordonia]AUH69675.1 hypothetical protein CXX93_16810 [Gordonia sp. YC-JH1]GAC62113.1 hypothetical protein GSI01S_29_00010 [Gordonia sihwensis NBRC 108236]
MAIAFNPSSYTIGKVRKLLDIYSEHALTDAQRAEVRNQLDIAEAATTAANNLERTVVTRAENLATKATTADPAAIVALAADLPSADAVNAVAAAAYTNAGDNAWGVLVDATPALIDALNARMSELCDIAIPLGEALTAKKISSADEAIRAGLAEAWGEFHVAADELADLISVVTTMRDSAPIAKPRGSKAQGDHWQLRHPLPDHYFDRYTGTVEKKLIVFKCGPYVPATEEEAAAVLASWNDAETPAADIEPAPNDARAQAEERQEAREIRDRMRDHVDPDRIDAAHFDAFGTQAPTEHINISRRWESPSFGQRNSKRITPPDA